MDTLYLGPAELFLDSAPMMVTTVLGSCVAVTFFHRLSGLASICHALQPFCPQRAACSGPCREQNRFVECVVAEMARKFAAAGIRRSAVEVKLFGGAAIIGALTGVSSRLMPVGRQNAEAAIGAISANGFSLTVANLGGCYGRKIVFNTVSGQVFLKKIGTEARSVVAGARHRHKREIG
jgi:chemotaxis protein CheD